ncbi:MAG: HlyD family efflux transporter periplasmic adaptor subunit [Dethiobacteria bacterium]|nr:HlyD family efflux transporter periplasmic adaptor subunit [Bacillota bacterium]NMD33022.1 hypothetical protein [Bacillota bacterium]HOB28184.1 HlyD family efflux transporter periplasmic adaptor subunit [Bacillota bacterium]
MTRQRRPGTTATSRDHLEVLPGKGRRFAHLRQASVFYIVLGLVALLVLQAAYHWMGPFILARRLQVVTAAMGHMEKKLEVEGLITRQELLLTAPCSGVIIELSPPGERAPAGTTAAVIVPLTAAERERLEKEVEPEESLWEKVKDYFSSLAGAASESEPAKDLPGTGTLPSRIEEKVPLVLPEAGLLLHRLDGWEGLEERTYLTAEQFAATPKSAFEAKEGLFVEEGQPVMKLIDNWQWHFNLLLPLEPGRSMAARETVLCKFAFAPEKLVTAELVAVEIDSKKEEVRLTYCIREQFPGFENLRWAAAELILEREEGIIIPAAALVEHEGYSGVFLNQGGMVKFQEITVLASKDGELLVEGLEPDSMVITRPELVEEGQRLN